MSGKLGQLLDVVQERTDGWVNALTGLGNSLRDKGMATNFLAGTKLSDQALETLYHEEDMAERICGALPEEALRKGYFITLKDDDSEDIPKAVKKYEKRLGFVEALEECAIWSRVFGGAVIYLGINDLQEESEPVNDAAIKSIDFAMVLDRRDITPKDRYDDPDNDEKFGDWKTYQINTRSGDSRSEGAIIHETRLLRMDGALTSKRRQEKNSGWSESVLQKTHEVLRQFNVGWQATSHLLQDASQAVFKVEGLIDMIAGGDKDKLQSRMELVEMSRSVARAIMLDAEREEFERQSYSFAGVPDVLRAFMLRLSAAARMPVVILMGQAPQGLNATGDSDIRLWYDRVQAYQTRKLSTVIEQFYRLVFLAQDFEAGEPEDWEVKWERLWQMTDKEQAELEDLVAKKDKTYIDAQVVLPEEVALSRFKSRGFSMETNIDMEAREEILQAEIELAKSKAGEEPEPVVPVAPGEPPATPVPVSGTPKRTTV